MSSSGNKENKIKALAQSKAPFVKPEPQEPHVVPLPKVEMQEASVPTIEPYDQSYIVYQSPLDVPYLPENVFQEGLNMVKSIKTLVNRLEIGSKLRQDVWLKEIEGLETQAAPSTMVAVCGSTGAGKSSLLNAILDDSIVPTSGMRACTAVVTEISYHDKKTIDADVSFLTLNQWRQELVVLLDDLLDEDGNVKSAGSEAGVAWSKVHAVYPSIDQENLKHMTVDQILAKDPRIASLLGTTKHITAKNSVEFAIQIRKYIDSKDQKRNKKDKSKSKEENKDKSGGKKPESSGPAGPALWPLISQVKVYCSAAALSSGVILVDLPGTGDANAARNSIAKQYMKNCDCVWILAPITRAVDDKTARDLMGDAFRTQLMNGNYDTNAITFIATKCDDISCSEVIRALQLDDDAVLEDIESRLEQYQEETRVWKETKAEAEHGGKNVEEQLKGTRALLKEYEEHLQSLKDGQSFIPKLTAAVKTNAKKRKSRRNSEEPPPKRRKSTGSDKDDFNAASDDGDTMDVDSDSESDAPSDCGPDPSSDASSDESDCNSENEDEISRQEEVTEDYLKMKIEEAKSAIKSAREQLSTFRTQKKEAVDAISTLKKKQAKGQREKNAFCSLKRSEFSRDVLKEDFRQGLKDMDDAAAEQRNPEAFDPSVNLRDYEKIDLPVFTCSSRDYIRLKGQVKGDGEPSCFSQIEDTCIPALQDWCHEITVSSRERSARNFLTHIKTFANSVWTYVEGVSEVTEDDRATLRGKWASFNPDSGDEPHHGLGLGWLGADPLDPLMSGLLTMKQHRAPKVDPDGEPVGVTPLLIKVFTEVIRNCVDELQERFRDGLEDKCQVGAVNAAAAAVEVSDAFAAGMHWGTYRATLRRHGEWKRDLNVELCAPLTKNIASSWSKVFEADLFASLETSTKDAIEDLIKEIEDSSPAGLRDRTRSQGQACQEEAKVALNKMLDLVKEAMNSEQKEVSRAVAPFVQQQLLDGYDASYSERGRGSVARQKKIMRDWIADVKDDIFADSADTLMERLAGAAQTVGNALTTALEQLAEKVEVSLSVLWEETPDDPAQKQIRCMVMKEMKAIVEQVGYWSEADEMRTHEA